MKELHRLATFLYDNSIKTAHYHSSPRDYYNQMSMKGIFKTKTKPIGSIGTEHV